MPSGPGALLSCIKKMAFFISKFSTGQDNLWFIELVMVYLSPSKLSSQFVGSDVLKSFW